MYTYMYTNIATNAASSPSSGVWKPFGGENPTICSISLCWDGVESTHPKTVSHSPMEAKHLGSHPFDVPPNVNATNSWFFFCTKLRKYAQIMLHSGCVSMVHVWSQASAHLSSMNLDGLIHSSPIPSGQLPLWGSTVVKGSIDIHTISYCLQWLSQHRMQLEANVNIYIYICIYIYIHTCVCIMYVSYQIKSYNFISYRIVWYGTVWLCYAM